MIGEPQETEVEGSSGKHDSFERYLGCVASSLSFHF